LRIYSKSSQANIKASSAHIRIGYAKRKLMAL
jgi:hypothetical protein